MTLPCFNEKYQNSQVSETKEFTNHFYRRSAEPDFRRERVAIMCYRGTQNKPKWLDTDPGGYHGLSTDLSEHHGTGNFTTLCEMQVDLSQVPKTTKRNAGKMYYSIEYDLILIFGITEFQAQVRWFEHVSLP